MTLNEAGQRRDCRRRKKQAGGLQTPLTAYVSARIVRELAVFYAGGVVLPRPYTAHDYLLSPGRYHALSPDRFTSLTSHPTTP